MEEQNFYVRKLLLDSILLPQGGQNKKVVRKGRYPYY